MKTFVSTAYLPPIQFFSKLVIPTNEVYLEQHENYIKQSYRNRCTIYSANGILPLSIPVQHNSGEKIAIKDVRIANHGNWQHIHWNAIKSAYGLSPFFEYYENEFYPFYHNSFDFLYDFNEQLINLLLDLLNLDAEVLQTKEYHTPICEDEVDVRELIHPKKDFRVIDPHFCPAKYYQVFEQKYGFIANLSIIDLLFNMGPESIIVLMNSIL